MNTRDVVDRVQSLRYSWLTPWVKAARLQPIDSLAKGPDEASARARLQWFLDDELYNWIPEASPWSALVSSSWSALDRERAVMHIDAIYAQARARTAAHAGQPSEWAESSTSADADAEEWAAALEARDLFLNGLFRFEHVRYFGNQAVMVAAPRAPDVPAIAAVDGSCVGLLWLE